jgi:hypothetical protein|tara:strand:- start:616 stop:888 length:273 start_codon:yes stop_codon:yes gene_type:complete
MKNINFRLDPIHDLNEAGLRKIVEELLAADDGKENAVMDKYLKAEKNDLADLDEETHGKPNTPKVDHDDLPMSDLADLPKPKSRKVKKLG